MSNLDKSNTARQLHPENILFMDVTLFVSNLDKFTVVKLLQSQNISLISLTFVVVILDKFRSTNALQPLNIPYMPIICSVSTYEISMLVSPGQSLKLKDSNLIGVTNFTVLSLQSLLKLHPNLSPSIQLNLICPLPSA